MRPKQTDYRINSNNERMAETAMQAKRQAERVSGIPNITYGCPEESPLDTSSLRWASHHLHRILFALIRAPYTRNTMR